MKRKIILSVAFAASLTLLLLTSSDSRVEAQNQVKIVANTGIVKLGQNQRLQFTVTADGKFGTQTEALVVRFRRLNYMPTACEGGVCKYAVSSQSATDLISLAPGEAASFDIDAAPNGDLHMAIVASNSQNVLVNAHIIDTVTGEVEAVQMSMQRENQ